MDKANGDVRESRVEEQKHRQQCPASHYTTLPHSLVITTLHQLLEGLWHAVLESALLVGLLGRLGARSELGLSAHLGGRARVLELGLPVDNVRVASGGLPDLWLGDDQQDIFRSSEGDSLDTRNSLEAETFECLPGLSLGSGLDVDLLPLGSVVKREVLDGHGGCGLGWWV